MKHSDGYIKLSQPCMIKHILEIVGLDDASNCTKMHNMPATSTALLANDPDRKPHFTTSELLLRRGHYKLPLSDGSSRYYFCRSAVCPFLQQSLPATQRGS